jgi:hypothetical protein
MPDRFMTALFLQAYSNFHQRALMADYPWEKFTPGTFVDCGGGQGYLSVLLAKRSAVSFP